MVVDVVGVMVVLMLVMMIVLLKMSGAWLFKMGSEKVQNKETI